MKKQSIRKILKINQTMFPYLIGITYFFLILESYMYIGFLRKFFLIDSRFFLVFSFFSMLLLLYSELEDQSYRSTALEDFVLNLGALTFFPSLIFYLMMTVMNSSKYPNYIFSTFHIQPQNFLNVVILGSLLFILKVLRSSKYKNKLILHQLKERGRKLDFTDKTLYIWFIAFIFLGVYLFNNFSITFNRIINNAAFIVTHANYTYDQKMNTYWGFYYDYIKFVKDNTPEDSTILIPPQSGHWLTSGNEWLDRYFLYPRRLVQGNVYDIPDKGYDYVMISRGEWLSDETDWGWPKVIVKAEKIWYIDSGTLDVTIFIGDFDPENQLNTKEWGLIKVK